MRTYIQKIEEGMAAQHRECTRKGVPWLLLAALAVGTLIVTGCPNREKIDDAYIAAHMVTAGSRE